MLCARGAMLIGFGAILLLGYTNCSSSLSPRSGASSSSASACPAADPLLSNPSTIDQVVTLINSLPKPLSIDCFLTTLPKPMQVFAVNNAFSAQPSAGVESPRIFILQSNLSLSVVPTGPGRNFLELGQFVVGGQSVKAEVEFPITANLPADLPYTSLLDTAGGTNCRFCHQREAPIALGFAGPAFVSDVVKPDPFRRVTSFTLRQYALACDSNLEAYRCAMLRAIFISGQGRDTDFP